MSCQVPSAGGNIHHITRALIGADRAGIRLDWTTEAAIDLARRDALPAVTVRRPSCSCRSEKLRAIAIATQQEMSITLAKSRVMLVLSEAEIPAAIAMAFRSS